MPVSQGRQASIPESSANESTRQKLAAGRKHMSAKVRKKLKVSKETVRRYQKRSDLYISTLRSYVEGVGGKLSLVVEFPDQAPVILAGLGMDDGEPRRKAGKKQGKKAGVVLESKAAGKVKAELKSGTKSSAKLRKSA